MFGEPKAIIYDMDGVLIDSEPLWRKAMISGFGKYGISFTDEDCRKTTGMRFNEVVALWLNHYAIEHVTVHELETVVIDLLVDLINSEGAPMPGIIDSLKFARECGLKTGLATSSSHRLMSAVTAKLEIEDLFDAKVSAEFMAYGKPHPEVFLVCAEQLNIFPHHCIVIEDSLNGVIAAKAAQMKAVAVPDKEHLHLKQYAVADYQLGSTTELLELFKGLLPAKIA